MLTLIILLALAFGTKAQLVLVDDFSDGNITADPIWTGDVGHFTVNGQSELQLDAPVAGTSRISTAITLPDTAEWQFYFQLAFAPSSANRLRVYLMLNNETPGTANGYALDIGESGSSDALRFSRIDNGTFTEIAASDGSFGTDPVTARLQIKRDAGGHWTFAGDLTGGSNFTPLFSADDANHLNLSARYFSLECGYSDTRRDKFFFDDIYATIVEDQTPPRLVEVVVEDDTHVQLQFDEPLDDLVLNANLYNISPGIGQPLSVEFVGTQQTTIILTSGQAFSPGTPYSLTLNQITDLNGNTLDTVATFSYIVFAQPNPYDILINEIMADPSPVIGLPNAEYLELYNSSAEAFQLQDYSLTVGSQTVLLPAYVLDAGAYVLVVDDGTVDLFNAYPNKIAPNLPGLTNTGTTIELADDLGNTLHRISYTLSSYQDPARDDGGWSLELINPLEVCSLDGNLRASQDLTGGTPGRQNSVFNNPSPDTEGPQLERVFPLTATRIQFVFDEVLSDFGYSVSLQPDHFITSYQVDQNILEVTLQTPMQTSTLYTATVHQVTDCLGNVRENQILTLGLTESAQAGDLIINEILFDPGTGGSRFIEIYNRSLRFIDLSEVVIADIQGDTVGAFPVESPFLLRPATVVAISPDISDLKNRYFSHDPTRLVQATIPSFDREAGNATIYTRSGVVLDVFDYSDDFHNALIDDPRGISLERISPASITQSRGSWQSAAATAGYATPGLPNSQSIPGLPVSDDIEISPETFSPDGDGFDDFLSIRFPNDVQGASARIRIYDTHGREIARIAENITISPGAIFRWDGTTAEGDRARIGPHIVWAELVSANGNVTHYKKMCVVAEKL